MGTWKKHSIVRCVKIREVPTRGPWAAFDHVNEGGRVHDAIQRGFRRGDGLWDWVWQAMHEGGGGVWVDVKGT